VSMRRSERSSGPVYLVHAGMVLCALGCSSASEDSGTANLPPDPGSGSDNPDTGQGFFEVDTGPSGDTGLNEEPPYELKISHTGTWERSPLGGPYTDMIGTMTVEESILGGATVCSAEFSLTGTVAETECDHCAEAFDVFYYMVSQGTLDEYGEQVLNKDGVAVAGLSMCQFPDLPQDGDTWRLGYAAVDGSLFWDYYASGVWVTLYDAEELHDEVTYGYETTVGFVPIEKDD
jgi:hypothetical protein